MKAHICLLAAVAACGVVAHVNSAFAQGTAFTYQGQLQNNGSPASGIYNLTFSLYNSSGGGTLLAETVTNNGVAVTNGLFTVAVDFGAGVWNGQTNWLQIAVETNGGSGFNMLTPRQQLTPTPYAIYAEGANAAGITGTIQAANLGGTYGNQVAFNNGADSFDGTFSGQFFGSSFIGGDFTGNFLGSGSGLIDVWHTTGNVGTTAGVNFLGTTDDQPLELHVNGKRAARFEPTADDANIFGAVNVIQGSPANVAAAGVHGATIAGGGAINYFGPAAGNTVADSYGTIGGGVNNNIQSNAFESTIAGGNDNTIQSGAHRSTISGGWANTIQTNAAQSFIGGGFDNQIVGDINDGGDSVISGGYQNIIHTNADYSAIGGGLYNTVYGDTNDAGTGTIAGGYVNIINSNSWNSFIGGGFRNQILSLSEFATVGGGYQNQAGGIGSFIGGGGSDGSAYAGNIAQANASVIGGGVGNQIETNAPDSTIGGGYFNRIQANASYSTIAGGVENLIQTNAYYSTIGGGFLNQIQSNAYEATIGGGDFNQIQTNAYDSVIGGGYFNQILSNATYSTIGGGYDNLIQTNARDSTIGGGLQNLIQTNAYNSTIAGGEVNQIQTNAADSAIGGGYDNQIQAYAGDSAIAGGYGNQIQTSAFASTIAGGVQNLIQTNAFYAAIGGGVNDTNTGPYATIPGGDDNLATNYSFAAGNRAKAIFQGDFVWADSQNADFLATSGNQVSFRCAGGVVFASGTAGTDQMVSWVPGTGAWSFTSDRNAKENFKPVDVKQVLEKVASLPLTEWNYKGYGDRHVGPMAQDFHAAFPFNANDKMLNSADEAGVSLAAIQGLNEKLDEKDAEIQNLKQRLEKLEQLMTRKNEGAK
jgi:hypothetical protein